ncbi:MAG: hypothetical protein GXP01_05370 [Alphaproteobacteria bacterium]|nr:hypothetical protein [Alphaproteobacteria bacterium]
MKIETKNILAEVQPFGAMIRRARFTLPDGSTVSPLFAAPWRTNGDRAGNTSAPEEAGDLPPVLRHLGAEWPCVPFGGPGQRTDLPAEWTCEAIPDWDGYLHGYGSNHDWQLSQPHPAAIAATINCPQASPISRLERTIELDPENLALDLSLTIHARRACKVPVGLHPTLELAGQAARSCQLEVSSGARAWTFPVDVEPGRSALAPDQRNVPFDQLLRTDGRPANAASIPFEGGSEDVIQLYHTGGRVGLKYPDRGYRVTISWDETRLPACQLWCSFGGREAYPWLGRVRTIGIEPVATAFDLGMATAISADTPMARAGHRTYVHIEPGQPFQISYRLEISSLT